MKRICLSLVLILSCIIPSLVFAESTSTYERIDEITVTATRIETTVKEVPSSVTVISRTEIEKKQKSTVLEVLRGLPGIDVARSGGAGQTTSIFIRGANAEHTLVLIDGVEMNDPISPGRAFDFANISVDNIERIEIVRGPQSTLYGSDAIGGVINIITKKGKGTPSGFLSASGGSFNTFEEKAGLSGGGELFNYSIGLSRLDTSGISAAGGKYGNTEKDGYQNTSFSTRLGLTPLENLDMDLTLRYIYARSDVDNCGGAGCDDPNHTNYTKQLFLRAQARLLLFNDIWEQKLGFSLSDHQRNDNNDTDPANPNDLVRSYFDSRFFKVDWQHDLHLHETNTLILGFQTEEDQGKSNFYSESAFGPFESRLDKKTARTSGYYLQDKISINDFNATLGARLDEHSIFGSAPTYRIGLAYFFKDAGIRLKSTYGTGFKAPSVYQLFSSFGNTNLSPEKSIGWDIGLEKNLLQDKLVLGATYFINQFENLIDFNSATSTYRNIGEAESKGVELFVTARPYNDLSIKGNYTFTETEDKSTGRALLRRARDKFGLDLIYRFLAKGDVDLGIVYVGKRDDRDFSTFPAQPVVLDAYTLVNLAVAYDILKNIKAFVRADNIFDKDYEEVKGYGTYGISAFGGIKVSF